LIYGLIFLEHTPVTSQQQRDEILKYAKKHNFNIDKFVSYKHQPDITLFESGDSVVFFAWNCICKKRTVLNNFIRYFLKNNVCMYSATSEYCLDGEKDFNQFEYAFNLYEDIRFSFASGRSIDGVKTRIANGKAPGRHKGARNRRHVLDGKENSVLKMYSNGDSMYVIAKRMKVSAPTIKRFLTSQN